MGVGQIPGSITAMCCAALLRDCSDRIGDSRIPGAKVGDEEVFITGLQPEKKMLWTCGSWPSSQSS